MKRLDRHERRQQRPFSPESKRSSGYGSGWRPEKGEMSVTRISSFRNGPSHSRVIRFIISRFDCSERQNL